MLFNLLIGFVILQRLIELVMAKRNEKWAKEQGGVEFGAGHYKYIVILHAGFFISLISESLYRSSVNKWWIFFLFIFLLAQLIRAWSLSSLGKHWNTKIIVIPNSEMVRSGPYRFFKHPNYFVVTIELLVLPLIFNAYITAILFSFLNIMFLMFIRIPIEEKALNALMTSVKQK